MSLGLGLEGPSLGLEPLSRGLGLEGPSLDLGLEPLSRGLGLEGPSLGVGLGLKGPSLGLGCLSLDYILIACHSESTENLLLQDHLRSD